MVGAFLFACAVNVFIVPQSLYNGSMLGISQLLRTLIIHISGWQPQIELAGIICYILNIPMLVLAYVALSRQTFVKTILGSTAMSLFLTVVPGPATPIIADRLTSCIIGGLVAGYGCGLMLRAHYNGGGTDVIGLVLTKKYASFSVGKITIAINVLVYTVCAVTQNLETAVYSIIYTVVTYVVVDYVHSENVCSQATIFCIREEDRQAIVRYLVDTLNRTATSLEGSGGDVHVILTVVSQYELGMLERYLKHNHSQVFLVKTNRVGIFGRFEKKLI